MRNKVNLSRDRMDALMHEHVEVVPYRSEWPSVYEDEERSLRLTLPAELIIRIDHIGSTAVPGLSAKPIIDVQVEVNSLDRVHEEVVPRMEDLGYEFVWRPTIGEEAPFYAWFIKRDEQGQRTHHIHMVEPDRASEDRLLFRDALKTDKGLVRRYELLKRELASAHPDDRAAYTQGKTRFITQVVDKARAAANLPG